MNVLMISPGFPAEMPLFTRGLARVGATVIGLGDGPVEAVPPTAREVLDGYVRVPSLWDEDEVARRVGELALRHPLHRIECLWEPGMLLAARLREEIGVPGMDVEHALRFRDKERMKQALDAAGLRTPRHARASGADEIRHAASSIGYPLIVKPIMGAGSADTYRVDSTDRLDEVLNRIRHVADVSVEEYVEGEEYTFDTICVDGEILYHNIAWYRPKPLLGRSLEWMSPQTVTLRDVEAPDLQCGVDLGRAVLAALEFGTGFTHMEWFRTPQGEAVFGEIAARPPGARSVDLMNFGSDIDTYVGWADATCHGTFRQAIDRRYNVAVVFKRARGNGRIREVDGLERLMARYGPWVTCVDLLPVGAPRRDWKQTLVSDGYVIVRHPDLAATLEMADRFGTDLRLFAS